PVEGDLALSRHIKARQQMHQGRFAASAGTDDCGDLPRTEVEVYAVEREHGSLPGPIPLDEAAGTQERCEPAALFTWIDAGCLGQVPLRRTPHALPFLERSRLGATPGRSMSRCRPQPIENC